MQVYAVGKAIRYLDGAFFKGIRPRDFSAEELIKESLDEGQEVRLFESLDDAKLYAATLMKSGHGHTPSSYADRQKAAAVFTVKLDSIDEVLKNKTSDKITYTNCEKTISYYNCSIESIKDKLVYAEIPGTEVQPVDMTKQPSRCLIM
jgi:hypothetical protein